MARVAHVDDTGPPLRGARAFHADHRSTFTFAEWAKVLVSLEFLKPWLRRAGVFPAFGAGARASRFRLVRLDLLRMISGGRGEGWPPAGPGLGRGV